MHNFYSHFIPRLHKAAEFFFLRCAVDLDNPRPLARQLAGVEGRHCDIQPPTGRVRVPLQGLGVAQHGDVGGGVRRGSPQHQLVVGRPVQDNCIHPIQVFG